MRPKEQLQMKDVKASDLKIKNPLAMSDTMKGKEKKFLES